MDKRFLAPAVLVAMLGMAAPASALPILGIGADDVGTNWSFVFGGNVGGQDVSGLTAAVDMTLTSFSGGTAVFDVTLENTTGGGLTSRVSAFGFYTTPTVVGGSSSGLFGNFRIGSFPNQTFIEACATNGNTCQGGGNGGVTTGNSGNFTLTMTFGTGITSFDLDGLAVRYQSISGTNGRQTFNGAAGTGTGSDAPPPQPVPEPTSLVLLGSGLLGAGLLRRRRRS